MIRAFFLWLLPLSKCPGCKKNLRSTNLFQSNFIVQINNKTGKVYMCELCLLRTENMMLKAQLEDE